MNSYEISELKVTIKIFKVTFQWNSEFFAMFPP